MITILPADEVFLQSIDAPAGADAMVLRDSDGSVFGHALFRMAGERVEVLSVETALATRGLRTTVLKRIPVVITIGPGHRLYNQPEISHRELENDFLIDRQDGIALQSQFYNGLIHLRKERTLFVTTEYARYQLVAKGLGYTIGDPAPRGIAEQYQLRSIPLHNLYHVLVALENPARPLHPAVATFMEYLKEELA